MRVPLGATLESRDGTVSKDAKVLNGIVEMSGGVATVRKRPGLADLGLIASGSAQLLYAWGGINAIIGDTLYRGTAATIVSAPTTTSISPTVAGLKFDAQEVGPSAATQVLMIKNKTQAWTIDRSGTKAAISFPSSMGAATIPVTGITRVSTTATATFASDPGFNVGDSVTIAGAVQAAYNGAQTVTAVTPYSFTPGQDIDLTITRSGTTATATAVSGVAHGLTTATSYTLSGAAQSGYNGSKTITVTSPTTFTYTVTVTTYTAYGAGVTWNASDKDAHVTLSGGSLVATGAINATSTFGAVRATSGKSTGSAYWEVTVTTPWGPVFVGVANSTYSLSASLGIDNNSWAYGSGGVLVHNGAEVASGDPLNNGDVVGVVLNMDAGTIAFYINGVLQAQATGLTGTLFPAICFGNSFGQSVSAAANFGATSAAFSYDDPTSPATGSPVITRPAVTVNATLTYTVAGSPTTPATGTITATGTGGMVPGLPYIDGYFFVMDTSGVVWASAIDDPSTWGALNFTTAEKENGAGKALAKSGNYLIAFKEWSTEFFYNASNQTGFPFSPVDNGFTLIGCASGDSVAKVDGNILFLSQVKERGRSVHLMSGLQQQQVSTPDVDRILGADDLATVHAYGLKLNGHPLYVLSLLTSNITLVYDLSTQLWTQWSTLKVGSTVSVSSITLSGSTATVTTATAHGLTDGDPVKIAGATQGEYNGVFQISYISTTVFTIQITGTPASATGTITAQPYTEGYFNFIKYSDYSGLNLVLHATNGHVFQISNGSYRDGTGAGNTGIPINLFVRTTRMDGGDTKRKGNPNLIVVADKVSDIAMLRWSSDDCNTFTSYRVVDLSLDRPSLRRNSKFRRRTYEFRYTGNLAPRIQALELEITP